MFIVRNLTSRTIILSDLNAEIGPHKILDLSKVAEMSRIEHSSYLKDSINRGILQVVKQTYIPVKQSQIDEDKLKDLIREVMNEKGDVDIKKTVTDTVKNDLIPVIESIRDRINNISVTHSGQPADQIPEPSISPEKLAELQQKAIDQMSENLGGGESKQTKRIKLTNVNTKNFADEL